MEALEARLGYTFRDRSLLENALMHSSYANENRARGYTSNERLEFLGDSVLGMVTATRLYRLYPDMPEGKMSRLRAELVCEQALHGVACALHLGDYIRLGHGEERSGGRERPSILADALEALFAAVYLDAGFEAAKGVIDRLYAPLIAEVDPCKPSKDPKTALQEWLQARRIAVPTYTMVEIVGEAHAQEFEVACEIPKLAVRTLGRGPSRRIAEQQSAELALATVRKK